MVFGIYTQTPFQNRVKLNSSYTGAAQGIYTLCASLYSGCFAICLHNVGVMKNRARKTLWIGIYTYPHRLLALVRNFGGLRSHLQTSPCARPICRTALSRSFLEFPFSLPPLANPFRSCSRVVYGAALRRIASSESFSELNSLHRPCRERASRSPHYDNENRADPSSTSSISATNDSLRSATEATFRTILRFFS